MPRLSKASISEDGTAKGSIGIGWAGEEALVHRLRGLKTDIAGRKKQWEQEVHAMLPQGATVQLVSADGWEDEDKQLSATFKVEIPLRRIFELPTVAQLAEAIDQPVQTAGVNGALPHLPVIKRVARKAAALPADAD